MAALTDEQRDVCEDCGRLCGTEDEIEQSFDHDQGNLTQFCFSDVLFDGDVDPDCDRIRRGVEIGSLRAEADAAKAEIERLRGDVRDLRACLAREIGDPAAQAAEGSGSADWCTDCGAYDTHKPDCAYVALMARTAVKP